jgi:hypothetical protein
MKVLKLAVALLISTSSATFGKFDNQSNTIQTSVVLTETGTLSSEQGLALAEFVEKNLEKNTEVRDFFEMVASYNQDSKSFRKISSQKRSLFNNSVVILQKELGKLQNIEASMWAKRVKETSATFNFIWNFNPEAVVLPEESEELIEIDGVFSSK